MPGRILTDPLNWLNIVGAALSTTYALGNWVSIQGCDELEAVCTATFDPASTLTSISFRLVVSEDQVGIDPLVTLDPTSTAAAAVDHTIATVAGQAVRARLQIAPANLQQFRYAKYVGVQAKYAGGAPKAGDIASSVYRVAL